MPPIEEYKEKYSYEFIEKRDIEGLDFPAYHIKNLSFINADNKEVRNIGGQSFLVSAASLFYHSMIDTVGHYELLKSKYPDLKIVFCTRDEHTDFKKHVMLKDTQVTDILNLYGDPYNVWTILDLVNNNYNFEEVIFLPNHGPTYSYRIIPKDIQESLPYEWTDLVPLRVEASKHLKNKFIGMLTKGESKKIYSARKQFKHGVQIDSSRMYEGEDKIIEYFEKRGYEIVNLMGMSLLDQFNIFYNASEIAGIKGTNLFCSIFAEPNTKVIQIYNSGFWRYDFESYFIAHDLIPVDIAFEDAKELPHDPDTPRLYHGIIIKRLDEYFNQDTDLSNSSDIHVEK